MGAVCDHNLEELSVADKHWRFYEPFFDVVLKEERSSAHMLRYSWGFLFFMVEFGYHGPYRVLNKLEDESPWLCWRDMFDVFQCYFKKKYGTNPTPEELPMSEIEDVFEMRGKCEQEKVLARMAKQYTVTALRNAKIIELRNMQRGKYFRIVADVYTDGVSLAEALVTTGLGVRYGGGKKSDDWCL